MLLAVGATAKIYPARAAAARARWCGGGGAGARRSCRAAVFAAVLAVCFVPFLVLAPAGCRDSIERQLARPLQIESLGAALLLVGAPASRASDDGVGPRLAEHRGHAGPTRSAIAATVAPGGVARRALGRVRPRADGPRAARPLRRRRRCVAFVALGKVLSPQFLIWLVPLVPLVRGRRGLAASALLAAALVLTQLWFPYRYWDFALDASTRRSPWLVLARDLVLLVALLSGRSLVDMAPESPREPGTRTVASEPQLDDADAAALAGVAPRRRDDALDPDVALGRLEADRHARSRMRRIASSALDADHGVVRAGHAGVGDRRRAAGEHARVVRSARACACRARR